MHSIGEILAEASHIIVDFRYVQRADQAAARLLEGLAGVRANPAGDQNVLVFEELNAALEIVENQILDLHRPAAPDAT